MKKILFSILLLFPLLLNSASVRQVTKLVRMNDGQAFWQLDSTTALRSDTTEAIFIGDFSYFTLATEAFGFLDVDSLDYEIVLQERVEIIDHWFFPNEHGSGADSLVVDTTDVQYTIRSITLIVADSARFILTQSTFPLQDNIGKMFIVIKMWND